MAQFEKLSTFLSKVVNLPVSKVLSLMTDHPIPLLIPWEDQKQKLSTFTLNGNAQQCGRPNLDFR
jgi:hypothetical protein